MLEEKTSSRLETPPAENVRTAISLAIVIHLFCVAVMLSSNFAPSDLQERLVAVLAPYTKTLHLDPNFVPYHLTTGEAQDGFHQWTVEGPGGVLRRHPDHQWRGGFPRKRLATMAQVAAFYATNDMEQVPAELARGLARHAIETRPGTRDPGEGVVVRCLRYVGPEASGGAEGSTPEGVDVVYEADVWVDREGRLRVLKRSPEAQVAPPTGGG